MPVAATLPATRSTSRARVTSLWVAACSSCQTPSLLLTLRHHCCRQGYPAFDETKEDLAGVNVTPSRRAELAEAIGDAPFYILTDLIIQQLFGWQAYLIKNSSGQTQYPKGTNHFNPDAVIFDKRHRSQIIMSNIGIALLGASLAAATYYFGFKNVACHCMLSSLLEKESLLLT